MGAEKHSPEEERRAGKHWPPDLQKSERISDKKTLSALFNNSLRVRTSSGSVIITIIPSQKWEMAVLVKKSVGNAVRRNQIKRKIREAYRQAKPLIITPFSIIFSIYTDPKKSDLNNVAGVLLLTLLK